MDLPKSPGALLRNLNKVLLDGSKALLATQKRNYNDVDANLCTNTRRYPVTHVCTAREH